MDPTELPAENHLYPHGAQDQLPLSAMQIHLNIVQIFVIRGMALIPPH